MTARSRIAGLGLLVLAIVMLGASVASACSRTPPPPIEGFSPGEPVPYERWIVSGVYEQEHIAEAPALVFVSSRTVSVVTRYWGMPPPNLGLVLHGFWDGLLSGAAGDCGNRAGHVGLVGYNYVIESGPDDGPADSGRPLPSILIASGDGYHGTIESPLSPTEEALLTSRFGPPVDVGVSPWDRIWGTLFVWRHHLAITPAVLLPLGFVISRRRIWRSSSEYIFNRGVVAVAAFGMVVVTLLVGHFGVESWFGMAVGFAAATGVAWLSRTAVSLLAAGLAADWLLAAAFGGSPGWHQMAGVFLFIVGAAALVWTGGHWSRWSASFGVVAGWILLLAGWDAPILLRAVLTSVVVVGVLWWTWNQRVPNQAQYVSEPIPDRT